MSNCFKTVYYFWLKSYLAFLHLAVSLSNTAINNVFFRYPNNTIWIPLNDGTSLYVMCLRCYSSEKRQNELPVDGVLL